MLFACGGGWVSPSRWLLCLALFKVTAAVTSNVNRVTDINYYPVNTATVLNSSHRPVGIGVQGLADTFIFSLSWGIHYYGRSMFILTKSPILL